jgi:circadian clock protein KaiB
MSLSDGKEGKNRHERDGIFSLRLYIAGRGPNSSRAIANLEEICRIYLSSGHRVEIIDILEEPTRAISDGILVTPTLIKLSPGPQGKVIGDLSETKKVLKALGLKEGKE